MRRYILGLSFISTIIHPSPFNTMKDSFHSFQHSCQHFIEDHPKITIALGILLIVSAATASGGSLPKNNSSQDVSFNIQHLAEGLLGANIIYQGYQHLPRKTSLETENKNAESAPYARA
jgi:hypothetical protein